MTRFALIQALVALTSSFDKQVKLVHSVPQPGSNAWEGVVFNDYTFSKKGGGQESSNCVLAQYDIMGQAAKLIGSSGLSNDIVPQTYHRDAQGNVVAALRINFRPGTSTGQTQAPVMDVNAELAALTQRFMELDGDMDALVDVGKYAPGMQVGILRTAVAKLESQGASETPEEDVPAGM